MSESPPGDNIKNLDLSLRAYNLLRRFGIRRVSDIEKFTDDTFLRVPGIGPKVLAEIRTKTRTFQTELRAQSSATIQSTARTAEFSPISVSHPDATEKEKTQDTLQSAVIGSPDLSLYKIPLKVLDLPVRPYNALMRDGCTALGHIVLVLQEFHASGVTSVRNLGVKSVADLEQRFNAYLAMHPSEPQSAGTLPATLDLAASDRDLQERWQNLLRTVADQISQDRLHSKAILNGRTLADWLEQGVSPEDKSSISYVCRSLASALATETVCDELVTLFAGFSASKVEIFLCRMEPKKCTLEEIGQARQITRERVRQIVGRAKYQIAGRLSAAPYIRLQSALWIAEEMGLTITYSTWGHRITSSRLLGNWNPETARNIPREASPIDLMLAVCNHEESANILERFIVPENLRLVVGHKNLSAKTVQTIRQLPKETMRAIRKQAKNGGAIYVPSVARDLALTSDETRSILSGLGYKQISSDWYMLRPRRGKQEPDRLWAVFHTVLKMLQFCGPLEPKEVCNGLRRHISRSGYVVPPPPIMSQVLVAYRFELQDRCVSWPYENPSTASASEVIILQEIERLGPVVSHLELLQAFTQAGLSSPALSVTLRYSPLFVKTEMGLYKLRGKVITHGDIQRAKERQPVTAADPEIKFEPTGAIRFRLNLGSMAIASGAIYTTHIPNLAGKWACDADSLACGTVSVRDNQIWGLARSFRTIKACVGDRVELKFDTWQRTVTVTKVSDGSQ